MAEVHDHSRGPAHSPAGGALAGAPPAGDPAQESLVRALRASFNILRILMIVLVVLYLLSGVFRVETGQQGLVARLGRLREYAGPKGPEKVFPPGWHPALPDPFEVKYVLTSQEQGLVIPTFLFNHPQAMTTTDLSQIVAQSLDLTPGTDGAMLTGDRNLSHGRWEVRYRIQDGAQFLQNVGTTAADFERGLLRRLTENAVVREVSGRTIEQVTRTAIDDVQERVQVRLQKELDELETGVQVVQIRAFTIEPGAVRPAFMDVARAENERLSLQEKAEEEANEILSRTAGDKYPELLRLIQAYSDAQLASADEAELAERLAAIWAKLDEAKRDGAGQIAVRLAEAEARADQLNQQLQAEYQQFVRYREQQQARPRITELSLWTQMREAILANRQNEIFFVPYANELEILVSSDKQRKLELEEERALKKREGGTGPAQRPERPTRGR